MRAEKTGDTGDAHCDCPGMLDETPLALVPAFHGHWSPSAQLRDSRTRECQCVVGPRQTCGRISGLPIWVQCSSASCCSTAKTRVLNFLTVVKRSMVGGRPAQVISRTKSCELPS